jgi:hypothetical protein
VNKDSEHAQLGAAPTPVLISSPAECESSVRQPASSGSKHQAPSLSVSGVEVAAAKRLSRADDVRLVGSDQSQSSSLPLCMLQTASGELGFIFSQIQCSPRYKSLKKQPKLGLIMGGSYKGGRVTLCMRQSYLYI